MTAPKRGAFRVYARQGHLRPRDRLALVQPGGVLRDALLRALERRQRYMAVQSWDEASPRRALADHLSRNARAQGRLPAVVCRH